TIADGSYKVARPLFVYMKKQHVDVIPGMKEFVAEFVSEKALGEEGYLAEKGLVTLPGDQLEKVKATVDGMVVLTAADVK
ncbi:MAG: phosphate ABC transporter substrate-binding protein, partial [Aestuariivirga sp.]